MSGNTAQQAQCCISTHAPFRRSFLPTLLQGRHVHTSCAARRLPH